MPFGLCVCEFWQQIYAFCELICAISITLISFLLRVPYDLFSYQLNIIIQTCFVWFGDSKFWIWIRLPDFRGIPSTNKCFFQQLIFRVVAKTSQFPCLYTLQTKCVMKFQIKSDDDIYRQHLEEGEKHRRSSLALRMEETFEELNLQNFNSFKNKFNNIKN